MFKRAQHILPFVGLLFFLRASNCESSGTTPEAPKVAVPSAIQPRPVFFTSMQRLKTYSPNDSQIFAASAFASGGLLFQFDASAAVNGSLLIFSGLPTAASLQAGSVNAGCVAGASNVAGHTWTKFTLTLSAAASTSQIYACQPVNPVNLLSATQKVVTSAFAAGTYYWVILGYDANFILTHSSAIMSFTIQ